jgi:hypothetical protein
VVPFSETKSGVEISLLKHLFDEDEGFAEALLTRKTKQMRIIPVNISIDPEFLVGSYDND